MSSINKREEAERWPWNEKVVPEPQVETPRRQRERAVYSAGLEVVNLVQTCLQNSPGDAITVLATPFPPAME
jgi:hypothetical protein